MATCSCLTAGKDSRPLLNVLSCDCFLGVPFNIASSALLLSIMARLAGLTPGVFTHFLADAHIYDDHINQVNLQLTRDHYTPPTLQLDFDCLINTHVEDVFHEIEPDQIRLLGYQSHPAIKAPMAV
jgi:thymidylate synthase